MEVVVRIFLIIASLILIASILLQSGKSAGMSGEISGGAESIWGKNKYAFSIATGMCVVSLSLVAGTVKNRLRKQKNNE